MSHGKITYSAIAPCLLAIVVDALGFGLVYPVMTALLSANNSPVLPVDVSLSLRHFYLGLSYMLYPFCMLFGTSFMGDLSDNYGRKNILLLLGRALSGLMAGSQPIAQAAIADLSTADTKTKNMSVIALSYSVGCILGPVLGGVTSDNAILPWFNFSTPFFAAALLAFCAFVWLKVSFEETYVATSKKTIQLTRPIKIFIEAFEHQSVRALAIVFLLMQVGFSIYFQFIVLHMKYAYQYNNWQLGAVQGMLGLGFAIGLLVGMPVLLKYWQTKKIAYITLLLTGLGQLLAAVIDVASLQWLLAIVIAIVDSMAFTAMLTLFSDAVDKKSQGWAMGIANAVMALSWALTGLFSNLLSLLGTQGLIFVGGICLLFSGLGVYKWLLLTETKV